MKTFKLSAAAVALAALCACAQEKSPYYDQEIESKVEKTLSQLTLEEKIGQMTQLVLDVIVDFDKDKGEFVINEEKLDNVIGKYKVGSILNAPGTIAQTPAKWNELVGRIQEKSMEEIGVPCIYGLDHIHGCTYILGSTLGPQEVNLAATFNPTRAYEVGAITGYESRCAGVPYSFSPCLDLTRNSAWSRNWENFGEDPFLDKMMGLAYVSGIQGENVNAIDGSHAAVSVKHYLGYSATASGKDRTPAYISISDLKDKHFAAFKAVAEAGALSIMVNSASINGMPTHANAELLTGWLKDDLKWDGVVLTDWADINNLYTREKIAKDKKEAIRIAINAGIDMAMEPYSCDYCDLLKELVEEGSVKMERIDDAVRRVLRMKYRLGLFDNPMTRLEDYPDFGSVKFADMAKNAAAESMVLLKNEDVLPLKQGARILLTGPNADSMRSLNGGWTYTWQGQETDRIGADYNTIYEALSAKFGSVNLVKSVVYDPAGDYTAEIDNGASAVLAAARGCDVIVACIGENSYCETPGNLDDLALSANQRKLVKALSATGKPLVLVLNEGRPRVISDIVDCADAIVDVMLPGNYGADALAELLSGERNFSGKLPFSYPLSVNSIITYDHKTSQKVGTMEGAYDYSADASVQWPFGFGLSYTSFEYSNLTVDKSEFGADDTLFFSVDLTNTGAMEGSEAVLLYGSDLVASIVPDIRRLRAFTKLTLKPGETRTVNLSVKASDLAFVGADGKWILEEGDFNFSLGGLAVAAKCRETRLY